MRPAQVYARTPVSVHIYLPVAAGNRRRVAAKKNLPARNREAKMGSG